MSIPRFYVEEENINDDYVSITGQDAKHLINVLRCKKGDLFRVFDGSGCEYSVTVDNIHKEKVLGKTLDVYYPKREANLSIILCQALPKGQKMELIVQKATEIGIKEIRPIITSRSLTSINSHKLERWRKIALEAVMQSGRIKLVTIEDPASFEKVLENVTREGAGFLFSAGKNSMPLKKFLRNTSPPGKIFIFIGPEGDFSEEEISMAHSAGLHIASLGPRILRTETAGLVAAGIMLYELDDAPEGI